MCLQHMLSIFFFLLKNFRLSERMVNKEQEQLLEKELPKARQAAANILRNQLDALRNMHFARENFEKQYLASISIDEEAQKKHNELLEEYLRTKLEYQFALKKAEILKKMKPLITQHYLELNELEKKRLDPEKRKNVEEMLKMLVNIEPDKIKASCEKKRESSISNESSLTPAFRHTAKGIQEITDKLFECGLGENFESQILSDEDTNSAEADEIVDKK